MTRMERLGRLARLLLLLPVFLATSAPSSPAPVAGVTMSPEDRALIAYGQPVLYLAHVQIVDGTGAPPRQDMSVLVENGRIARIEPADRMQAPPGAEVFDGRGKTLLPGFVMLHEHMFYSAIRADTPMPLPRSFSRLYLAGGVTTMRTAGSVAPYADVDTARAIAAGEQPGPDIDATSPLLGDDVHVGMVDCMGPTMRRARFVIGRPPG